MNTKLCLGLNNQYVHEYQKHLDTMKKVGVAAYFLEWTTMLDVNVIKNYGDKLGLVCQSIRAPTEKMADMWKQGEEAKQAVDELLTCVEACAENQIPMLVCCSYFGNENIEPNDFGPENFKKVALRAESLGVKIALENTGGDVHLDKLMLVFKNFSNIGLCWNIKNEIVSNAAEKVNINHGGRLFCTNLSDSEAEDDWTRAMTRLNRHGYEGMLTFQMDGEVQDVCRKIEQMYLAARRIAEIKANAFQVRIEDELAPAVFVVNQEYHIMMYPSAPCLMWVKVGDKVYYDEMNGILRSLATVHKVVVPMEELDLAKSYTLCLRYVLDRKPYFPEIEPVQERVFEFIPVLGKTNVRAYQIADAHNWSEGPIRAAKTYGAMDFFILNGDIPDFNSAPEKCITLYELTSAITGGHIPVISARGNHDLRGLYAERFWECSPTDNGKSYYTFRLGNIWGMLLDCAEDKLDTNPEYGGTVCCHEFRQRQTAFIQDVVARANEEYLAEGITHRIVICHYPFTMHGASTLFDIENELYQEWTDLLGGLHLDAIFCGHSHRIKLIHPGDESDHRHQPCPVIIGSDKRAQDYFAGVGIEFDSDGIKVTFTDSNEKVISEERL